jgi:molybdate transport system substrate-binding protein
MTPTQPLRLMVTNSTHALLDELLTRYEAATGQVVTLAVETAKVTRQRIEAGEAADAVILGESALAELATAGYVVGHSMRPFARARVGVAVRRGSPRPAIASVAELRDTLVRARCIAHTEEGASGRYIPTLLRRLGIAESMRGRVVTRPGGPIGPVVIAGEAELALQQVPELLAVQGLDFVGLLPDEVQCVFDTAGGLLSTSERSHDVRLLFDFLVQPAHRTCFAASGLELRC